MRKILAFILSLVLVLTFCSCGKDAASSADGSSVDSTTTTPEGFYIEYKDTQAGYITHTSELLYQIDPATDFECMGDFYIYLPEGTEIASITGAIHHIPGATASTAI